jgi:CubicO group peptidase (beta-lactamase class C family)
VVIAGIVFARVGHPLINVATAYKAKALCSEVFVAGRTADEVKTSLNTDDLRALRFIGARVDTASRTTNARLFPFSARVARHDESLGCVLSPPGEAEIANTARPAVAKPGSAVPAPLRDPVTTPTVEPNAGWVAVLDDAFAEPNPDRPRRTRAIVVLQHGSVVTERYALGVGPDTPMIGWSMAKSVMNALVGVAVRRGALELDDPARIPEWSASDDARGTISVDDLLHMSSGLRFEEGGSDPTSDLLTMLYGAGDMAAVAMNQPLEARPGTRWKYSSGTTLILSRLLRNALGEDAYRRFPHNALFEPLGMTSAVMEADASGTLVGSSYMYATARDWARFGQLYLQDGVWRSERILPEGWVEYTRKPAPAAPDSIYGAHFWLRTPGEYRGPAATLPPDVFHAVGHEGQFLTIVPSYDAVIVRLGRTRYPESWAHDRFVAAVLATLRPSRAAVP